MPVMLPYDSVDTYISSQSAGVQAKLQQLRQAIRKNAPDAVESISYGMPAYKYLGKPLVYFAACKSHIGFYALPKAVDAFKEKLAAYDYSKGTIRFPHHKPLPVTLIKEIVRLRVTENKATSRAKKAKPATAKLKKA